MIQLKDHYLHDVVEQAHPFLTASKDRLNHAVDKVIDMYARCITRWDFKEARRQLKLSQRENIAWERDTVWRQMIGQERRGEIGDGPKAIGESTSSKKRKKPVLIEFESRYFGTVRISRRLLYFLIALVVFVGLLTHPVLDRPEPSNCFAILCFATVLWATEVRPLSSLAFWIG